MPILFTVTPDATMSFGAGTEAVQVDCSDSENDTPITFNIVRQGVMGFEGYGPATGPIDVPKKVGTTLESINNQSEVDIDVYSV